MRDLSLRYLLFFSVVLTLATTSTANACSCGPQPSAEKWLDFKITPPNEKIDGDVHEKTDEAGRFTLTVLKGLMGELSVEDWLMEGIYKNCPKVDELLAQSKQKSVTVRSNVIKLTTEQDVFNVELTLPFPPCEKAKE